MLVLDLSQKRNYAESCASFFVMIIDVQVVALLLGVAMMVLITQFE